MSESTVRAFVAQARAELEDHAHQVTVPQAHAPGAEAEVDFGQFSAYVAGRLEPLWMFCMRLSFSGRGLPRGLRQPGYRVVPGGPRGRLRRASAACLRAWSATTT